jgi:hypothetical protein
MAAHAGDGHVERREAEGDLGADVLEIYGMLPQEARPTNPPALVWIPVPLPLPSCPVT